MINEADFHAGEGRVERQWLRVESMKVFAQALDTF
jgi:hypothetical protein